jgi:TolB-like protein
MKNVFYGASSNRVNTFRALEKTTSEVLILKNSPWLLLLCILVPLFARAEKLNIAVSDLAGQGVDLSSTAIISDRLRTELFKQGGFSVLERNAMQDILKEQGFQQSGCTSDACAVQIGQMLGVSYIVVGTVGKLGQLFTVDVRMIDVSTGKIVYSENVDCECPIEKVLTNSVVSIAQKIHRNIMKTSDTTQATPAEQNNQVIHGASPSSATKATAATSTVPAPKRKKGPALTITCGAVTVIAAGAGIVFDNMLNGKINDNASMKAAYQSQPGNSQYSDYSAKITQNTKDANTDQALRNVSYIIAGLGAVGFAITFVF